VEKVVVIGVCDPGEGVMLNIKDNCSTYTFVWSTIFWGWFSVVSIHHRYRHIPLGRQLLPK